MASESKSIKNSNAELKRCREILQKILSYKWATEFKKPVWVLHPEQRKHYMKAIKNPMDFGTIQKNLNQGKYANAEEFAKDVRQVFKNCFKYNRTNEQIFQAAKKLVTIFNKLFVEMQMIDSNDEDGDEDEDEIEGVEDEIEGVEDEVEKYADDEEKEKDGDQPEGVEVEEKNEEEEKIKALSEYFDDMKQYTMKKFREEFQLPVKKRKISNTHASGSGTSQSEISVQDFEVFRKYLKIQKKNPRLANPEQQLRK